MLALRPRLPALPESARACQKIPRYAHGFFFRRRAQSSKSTASSSSGRGSNLTYLSLRTNLQSSTGQKNLRFVDRCTLQKNSCFIRRVRLYLHAHSGNISPFCSTQCLCIFCIQAEQRNASSLCAWKKKLSTSNTFQLFEITLPKPQMSRGFHWYCRVQVAGSFASKFKAKKFAAYLRA